MKAHYKFTFILLAMVISQAATAQGTTAESLFAVGEQLYHKGKFQSSSDSLEKAAVLFEWQKNISGQIKSLHLVGDCKATLGDCEKAQAIIKRSLQLAKENFQPMSAEVAESFYYLARTCGCTRLHDEGIGYLKKSIELKRKLFGEGTEIAYDYNFIGYFFTNLGQARQRIALS